MRHFIPFAALLALTACGSNDETTTHVFAARLERPTPSSFYPLAWEWNSTDVPGVDRTEYYTRVCSKC